ncbi:MAG TPA: hypothetical protein VMJ72_01145, partial [Candidatus Paceibacterota bacterium]|nr:hypothetical protein [Candidatus Paceibacterota bacterium]
MDTFVKKGEDDLAEATRRQHLGNRFLSIALWGLAITSGITGVAAANTSAGTLHSVLVAGVCTASVLAFLVFFG